MSVLITNNQNRFNVSPNNLRKKAQTILNDLGYDHAELSILIVDDPQMTEYNSVYLDKDGPTNVIAFPMQEGDFAEVAPYLLGDVVISIDTASREAEDMDIHRDERLDELLVHGILHLVGYDHEKSEADAVRMEQKSDALVALIRKMVP
jgi:probable rRNA maturation factor